MGAGLLACVFVLQLASISIRLWQDGANILLSNYNYVLLICLSLVTAAFVLTFKQRTEFTVLLISLIGFVLTVLNRLSYRAVDYSIHHSQTFNGLISLHIALAVVSYAALTLSAVFAIMYLFLHRKLKRKKWNDTVRRLPSLEALEKYINISMRWGTSLLAVSLIVGVSAIVAEKRWELLADMKVAFTFVALVIYTVYFAGRRMQRYSGKVMANWAIIGYVVTIANFLLNSWSAFHQWTGR
ncbi:cytochrome c biogenesis protein CcsA [Paenibacillus sp. J22TS3]|uniref:cytochrome c biogenesis protein CcsA n=1 Tax=Paenibacillus sp. J22TS3 TaxID=2807192 RepID=UPI001FD627E1|nr:cytochrome c biogenesis protein CcsA [Paenibacillus sp. J22TS3]